jgi:hypothetical protein
MKSFKRVLFLVAVLSLFPSWSSAEDIVNDAAIDNARIADLNFDELMSSECGYDESDPSGGGFSYCIHSWCGSSCQAVDCVYADGGEYHWISGCGSN